MTSIPKIDPCNNLPSKRYFEIAREMTSGSVENPKWTQDGSSLCCEFRPEKYGAEAIRYDNLVDGESVIAALLAKEFATTN